MTFQFAVLGSGSRGNSALVRHGEGPGLLIDVGFGPRAIDQRLSNVGSDWSRIAAVVLTHTHGDHVESSTLQTMAKRGIALYCHEGHRDVLDADAGFQQLERHDLVRFYDNQPFLAMCGYRVEPIPLRHDGGPTFGFRIECVARRRTRAVSVGYLADTGSWTDAMADSLSDVDILGVEFNHDVALQKSSGRSPALIARNLGDRGHLSNRQGAELVRSVLARSGREKVGHLVLLHLSEQCNRPELALREAREAVRAAGRRVTIHAALQSPAHPDLRIGTHRALPRPSMNVLTGNRAARPARAVSPTAALLPGLDLE